METMKSGPKTKTFMGRPSLESRVLELYDSGKSEENIAKTLHTSLKYVHGALVIFGRID